MVSALLVILAAAVDAVPPPCPASCYVATTETNAERVERLKREPEDARKQLRLEKAAAKVNRSIERRKAKR